jgi:innexin
MEFIKISEVLSTTHLRNYRDDDLWIDRLSHRYSVVIFCVFAILVTTKAYIGSPIDCWSPPEFKASYERYAETLCFVNGTYYISATEIDIPIDPTHRYSNPVRYYQWTPFILLLLA